VLPDPNFLLFVFIIGDDPTIDNDLLYGELSVKADDPSVPSIYILSKTSHDELIIVGVGVCVGVCVGDGKGETVFSERE
jgi:hypothetical protein